jgi:Hint module
MDSVDIGDIVRVGPSSYSKVFMFTHRVEDVSFEFIEISTASGARLILTEGHYIPVNGQLVPASAIALNAEVRLGNGNTDKVVSKRRVTGRGLYNPQTLHGEIVVDGVVASTYTTAIHPMYAHAFLLPFRYVSRRFGLGFSLLEHGGGMVADSLPAVHPTC